MKNPTFSRFICYNSVFSSALNNFIFAFFACIFFIYTRFENTHEAIIAPELWKMVQEIHKHKKYPTKRMEEQPSPFSKMVCCADCGAFMRLTRRRSEKVGNSLKCSTCNKREGKGCTAHCIQERQLKAIVLDDLRRVPHYARQKEKLFVKHISKWRVGGEARSRISSERAGQAEKARNKVNHLVREWTKDED